MTQKDRNLRIVSFAIPFIICIGICIANGVYPFGEQCILHVDMYHQYCPFFTEFMNKLKTGGNLMYSWNIGLGSDFISVYTYYLASPLNWFLFLCPENHVIEFMTLLILLKIAFAGFGMYLFLEDGAGQEMRVWGLLFSTAYALSGFVCAYSWNIMWMDSVALAPVIMLGLKRLVKEQRPMLYYVTLSLSILANYYISMMICMFLVFYFAVLFFENRGKLAAVLRFAWYSLLAGGTGVILMLPEMKILSYSGSSGISFPKEPEWYFSIIPELSRGCTTAAGYTGTEHWPNLYAGAFSYLFLVLYLCNSQISWKKKLPRLGMVVLFLLSFANNYLDFIWHGLHFPDSLPGRQSFLYIFLILVLGFEVLKNRDGIRVWQIGLSALFCGLLLGAGAYMTDTEITDPMSFLVTALFIFCYAVLGGLLCFCRKKFHEEDGWLVISRKNQLVLQKMLFAVAMAELVINMAVTGFYTTSRTTYTEKWESYQNLLACAEEESFFRVEDTERLTKNDDSLLGYASATQFSSLMNINVSHFFQSLYMEGGKNFYCYNGATPIPSAMLSVRYFLSETLLPDSPLRTYIKGDDKQHLYRNNYCLPIGFVMEEEAVDALNLNVHSKLEGINQLGRLLGAQEDMLRPAAYTMESEPGETRITVQEDGYFYADNTDCMSDTLTISSEDGRSTTYSKTTHRYLFDLGYYHAGDVIRITNRKSEEIPFFAYKLDMKAVEQAYEVLNRQTFEQTGHTDTSVDGNIQMDHAARLIFSIPSEEGWSLFVDGTKQEIIDFEDTFISVSLPPGEHQIHLQYQTPGLLEGAAMSVCCAVLAGISLLADYSYHKKKEKAL